MVDDILVKTKEKDSTVTFSDKEVIAIMGLTGYFSISIGFMCSSNFFLHSGCVFIWIACIFFVKHSYLRKT